MSESDTTVVAPKKPGGRRVQDGASIGAAAVRRPQAGFFTVYKPEQGKYTRRGTFVGALALIAWGAVYLNERLKGFEGDEWWSLLITPGVAIAVAVVLGAVAWRVSLVKRGPCDFMIATEGEMKKVSWSSRREVIGSTKVVILFTVLLAALLFVVDLVFQALFRALGVLYTPPNQ